MPKHKPLPPLERLNELLEVVPIKPYQYGTKSGLLWRVNGKGKVATGNNAGSLNPHPLKKGRLDWRVYIDGNQYYVSRIIYFMVYRTDPGTTQVDHKDKNPFNNNKWNLRLGDSLLQAQNRGIRADNISGAVGVGWHKKAKKWRASIRHKGVRYSLGLHTCKIEAARIYNDTILEFELDKLGKPLNNLDAIACDCQKCLLTQAATGVASQ